MPFGADNPATGHNIMAMSGLQRSTREGELTIALKTRGVHEAAICTRIVVPQQGIKSRLTRVQVQTETIPGDFVRQVCIVACHHM